MLYCTTLFLICHVLLDCTDIETFCFVLQVTEADVRHGGAVVMRLATLLFWMVGFSALKRNRRNANWNI